MRSMWVHEGRGRRILALLLALAVVTAACAGDDDDSSAASDSPVAASDDGGGDDGSSGDDGGDAFELSAEAAEAEPEPEADDAAFDEGEEASATGGGARQGGATDPPEGTNPADLGRSIVFVANVDVVVDDVILATSQAKTAIAGLGGLVFGENTEIDGTARTTLEFKVFPEDFQEALTRLEGLGELRGQQVSADDVTERVVDLESRITTAAASVERLRGFLESATDSDRVAELELQLLERETLLEQLRGQFRTLQGQVDLATIFLTLNEAAPPAVEAIGEYAVSFHEGTGDGDRCPGAEDLRIDEGEAFTICVEVVNTGSNPMVGIEVRDVALDLDPRDFTVLGEVETLEPGEALTAFATTEAPDRGRSDVIVRADAAGSDGQPLRVGIAFERIDDADVGFIEDTSLPGFTDVLSDSWGVFTTAVAIAVLVLAAMVPFIWIPIVVWLAFRCWVRRDRDDDGSQTRPSPPPPAGRDDDREPQPIA